MSFQRLQVAWANAELTVHGHLLKATMHALPETLPKLSATERQNLMRVSGNKMNPAAVVTICCLVSYLDQKSM